MNRKPLSASRLRSVGYDERERILELEFRDGTLRQYLAVSPEVYRRLLAAPSPDAFYADEIEERFPERRVSRESRTGAAEAFDALFRKD
ncbi:MAG: KTSC domain-containing protein [Casimicrobiaceae bacterium]|nr:KTSC domain-containing protein [Casimicrobiaceae bacterium]MDW8311967.1 KTSC domain-containing protein [Burkholderiales bacterium]